MKHLIFALLMGISIVSAAQNGGQNAENNSVKVEYVGNGNVKISNKQTCESVIRFNNSQTEVDLTVPANSFIIQSLPSGIQALLVKAKAATNCGSTDFGWVELNIVTPLKFISKTAKYLPDTDELLVTFTISDSYNVNRVEIEISIDGGHTYRSMGLVWPMFIIPNKPVSYKIKCSDIRNYFNSKQ
jgi:hypothetical protein